MLVLSRKPNESIMVDGGIKIMVIEVKGNSVLIGIEAPPEMRILRQEIWVKMSGNSTKPEEGK